MEKKKRSIAVFSRECCSLFLFRKNIVSLIITPKLLKASY